MKSTRKIKNELKKKYDKKLIPTDADEVEIMYIVEKLFDNSLFKNKLKAYIKAFSEKTGDK